MKALRKCACVAVQLVVTTALLFQQCPVQAIALGLEQGSDYVEIPASEEDADGADELADASFSSSDSHELDSQQTTIPDSGWTKAGTCEWMLDSKKMLTVRPLPGLTTGHLPDDPGWSNSFVSFQIDGDVSIDSCAKLFWGCSWVREVDLTGLATGNVSDFSYMFYGCQALEHIDLSSLDLSMAVSFEGMFENCSKLRDVAYSETDLPLLKNAKSMFENCAELKNSSFLVDLHAPNVTSCSNFFRKCKNLCEVNLGGISTNNVSDFSGMFSLCLGLEHLDLSGFDTSHATDFYAMFLGTHLVDLDLSGFDTSNVQSMRSMFQDCAYLESVDLSSFNTSRVELMLYMFSGCESLKSIDLTSFDTRQVTSMRQMFYNCRSASRIDVSTFITSAVTDACEMFKGCDNVKKLDLSGFDIRACNNGYGDNYVLSGNYSLRELSLNKYFHFGRGSEIAEWYGGYPIKWADENGVLHTGSTLPPGGHYCAILNIDKEMFDVDLTDSTFMSRPITKSVVPNLDILDDSDFEINYENNINAGKAVISIKGHNLLNGSVSYSFNILPKSSDDLAIRCPFKISSSQLALPDLEIFDGNYSLRRGVDYNVLHFKQMVGFQAVTIKFMGNYFGTVERSFVLNHAGTDRVSGDTRYDTMGSLTERGNWAKGGSLVLASGANYPDALAASSLAGGFNGPILLTDPNGLSSAAKNQLELLCPSKVFIVGGNAAVSPAVERQVKELLGSGCAVFRVAGQTRYETSLVAAEINPKSSDTVIVATGGNYADALSVSPYAFASGSPVVLCDKSSGLTAGAMGTISSKKYSKAVIVGGTAAVPASVERQLRSAGVKNITRLSGATRYDTSTKIADFELKSGLGFTMDGVMLATGKNFPDALSAGPLAGRSRSPLLLVDPGASYASSYLSKFKGTVRSATVVGGAAAVPERDRATIGRVLGI